MNLNKLFKEQSDLDQHIFTKKGLTRDDTFNQRVVAFIVEMGELMNENENIFKYWKDNAKRNRDLALKELVDCIHFGLSLAIDCGVDTHDYIKTQPTDMNKLFIGIVNNVTVLSVSKNKDQASSLLNNLIALGYALGFTETEVITQYQKKNNINYERQEAGY